MKKLQAVFSAIAGFCLVIVFLVTFGQVIERYVFHVSMPWASDVTRFAFVYSVFLGTAVGVMKRGHLNIDVLVQAFPAKFRPWFDLLATAVMLFFLAAIFWYSIPFVQSNMDQMANYVRVPMGVMYVSVPITVAVMLACLAVQAVRQVRALSGAKQAEAGRR